jgi:hypothetical protein
MSRTTLRYLRFVGPFAVVAALGMGSLPALAQTAPADCTAIHFELANPGAGSRVEQGNSVVQGIATDKRATAGTGIDRVDFFLDSRDQGGISIGTAAPGMVPGPFGPGSFQTTISFPNINGGHDLVAYAHSSVTGQESIISMPIGVGEDPAAGTATTATETCTKGGNVASTTTAPATTTAPVTTTPATTTTTAPAAAPAPATSTASIVLSVANPSPGDTIKLCALNIGGSSMDKSAAQGSGIDRIDIFLDNRDAGGTLLTQASWGTLNNWQATVTLPSNQTGLHELVFYAHSMVSGQEMVVTVPVTIEH